MFETKLNPDLLVRENSRVGPGNPNYKNGKFRSQHLWRDCLKLQRAALSKGREPQSGPQGVIFLPQTGRTDLPAYLKFVLDAGEKALYHNDNQIDLCIIARKPDYRFSLVTGSITPGMIDSIIDHSLKIMGGESR